MYGGCVLHGQSTSNVGGCNIYSMKVQFTINSSRLRIYKTSQKSKQIKAIHSYICSLSHCFFCIVYHFCNSRILDLYFIIAQCFDYIMYAVKPFPGSGAISWYFGDWTFSRFCLAEAPQVHYPHSLEWLLSEISFKVHLGCG